MVTKSARSAAHEIARAEGAASTITVTYFGQSMARVAPSISMWAMSSTALLAPHVADGGSRDDGVPRGAFLAA
jgi:hypothetical protein